MSGSNMRKKYYQILKFFISLIIAFCLVIIAFDTFPVPRPEDIKNKQAFVEYLKRRIPEYMETYDISGLSMSLVTEGRIIWSGAFGLSRRESGLHMTPETPCRVESISKSLTAWGIMKLAEEGKIDLDAPLNTYLKSWQIPDSPFDENLITVRMLLTQTSGMPLGTIGVRYDPGGPIPSLREQLTQDAFLFQPPGSSFYYSNTGFNLLELLIEEISGRSFADYMHQEIMLPLGMENASFKWKNEFADRMPNGYGPDNNPIPPYIYPDKASGGLFATANDIAAFTCAGMSDLNDDHVLNRESINEIYAIHTGLTGFYSFAFDGYGYGHFIEILNDSLTAVSHGGQGSGWMSHFHSVPETGSATVMLTNSQNSWPVFGYILRDWSQWRGYDPSGMTVILTGIMIMQILIGLIMTVSLFMFWDLAEKLVKAERYFAPFSSLQRPSRLISFSLALIIGGVLLWTALQDYFFLTSIFPLSTPRLGISLLILSVLLLSSALFPRKPKPSVDISS
jgi:CubicO group peptidase (beta-lactamase class C family)